TLALGESLLNVYINGAAIFGVHADQAGMLGGLAHGAKNRGVVEHEHAGIGHEELEAGDAFANELAHFLELRGAEIGDYAVEGVVRDSFVVSFFHPSVKGLAEGLAFVLDGEVDQRGGAADSGGGGAGLKVVSA